MFSEKLIKNYPENVKNYTRALEDLSTLEMDEKTNSLLKESLQRFDSGRASRAVAPRRWWRTDVAVDGMKQVTPGGATALPDPTRTQTP